MSGFLERWPGYNEQSWSERFAELDRRHTELKNRMYREIALHGRITAAAISAPETNQ